MICNITTKIRKEHARAIADVLDDQFGFRKIVPMADQILAIGISDERFAERFTALWTAVRAEGEQRVEDHLDDMRQDAADARGDE